MPLHVLLEPVAALFFQPAPRRIAGKAADEDLVVRVDRQPDAVGNFVGAHFRGDHEPHVVHRVPGHPARLDRCIEPGIVLQRPLQVVLDHVKRHSAAYRGAKAGGRALFSPGIPEVALLPGIAFMGALIFGVTGFGAALVTIPLATHLVPLKVALALFVLADLACALRIGFENPRRALRDEWVRLAPMIVVGTALGVTLLVNLPRATATLLLGLFILGFGVYSLLPHKQMAVISVRWAWLAGLAGGITSTLFGAGGPPYAIYLSHRGLAKEQYRATMGFATLTSISLRAVAFFATGILLDAKVWTYAIVVVPAGLAGLWAAGHLFRRISRETLMRGVALMLLASGASLVLRALS